MIRTLTTGLTCLAAGIVLQSAQATGLQPLPPFDAPAGVAVLSSGGYGQRVAPEHTSLDLPATGSSYRLKTTMSSEAIATHYTRLLGSLGWKQTFRAMAPQLGVVRFSVGPAADPMTGTLTVMPFVGTGEAVVAVRLVRSLFPWRSPSRRSGGGGANTASGSANLVVDFTPFAGTLTLPASVQRAEKRGGGGSNDYYFSEVRFETLATTAALMDGLLKQADGPDWVMDARVGDSLQTVARRSSKLDEGRSEIWMMTSMPGVNQVDVIVASICATRPTQGPRGRGAVPSIPCANPR